MYASILSDLSLIMSPLSCILPVWPNLPPSIPGPSWCILPHIQTNLPTISWIKSLSLETVVFLSYHFDLGFCPLGLVNLLWFLIVLSSKLPWSFISWCAVNEDNLGQGLLIFCFYLWVNHVFVVSPALFLPCLLLRIMCDTRATLRVFLALVLCNAGDKASWS